MTYKIAITDDHEMVLKGIETMLSDTQKITVVGTYANANETIKNIGKDNPDVLLLDINLPDFNGIDLCKQLTKTYPNLKIIALTNFDETSFVKRMLINGAHGYLLKNTNKTELIDAIKKVAKGEQYLQLDIQKKLLFQSIGKSANTTLVIKLTRREKEVLQAISEELTTKEISEKLFISPKTVETHRMNLMNKLGAKNSIGLIKIAIEKQLL